MRGQMTKANEPSPAACTKKIQAFSSLSWALSALAGVSLLWVCGCVDRTAISPQTAMPAIGQTADFSVLVGDWRRPDGGYVLHIARVSGNGDVDASYFNPASVHVAKALASQGDGRLKVYVQLRDVNYPGSTYRLTYDSADDRLKGTYYQAVAQETFQISFWRVKP